MLAKHNAKSVGMTSKKIPSFIRPVKNDQGLQTPSTYIIECKQVYIGQTDRQQRPGWKSTTARATRIIGGSWTPIWLSRTHTPTKKSGYVDRFIREVSSWACVLSFTFHFHFGNFQFAPSPHPTPWWKLDAPAICLARAPFLWSSHCSYHPLKVGPFHLFQPLSLKSAYKP